MTRQFRDMEPAERPAKTKPSELRRAARRVAKRLEYEAQQRAAAYAEGARPNDTFRHSTELSGLHGAKRVLRSQVVAAAPAFDRPVYRRNPGAGA